MPIAVSGVYQLTLQTERSGQALYNVWHYLDSAGVNVNAQECLDLFLLDVIPDVQNLVSVDVTFVTLMCTPLFGNSLEIIHTFAPATVGNLAGETMPSTTCFSLKFNRTTRETRSGWKRIGPMVEANVAGDEFTGGFLTNMSAAAVSMGADLVGAASTYEPIIYRAANSAQDPLPRWQNISGVTALNRVTTQNSRKKFS